MNGKEGDNPYTDIIHYQHEVFGEGIDGLVRELDALGGFKSEIARDWLWMQADLLQRAVDAQDTDLMRGIRDHVESDLDWEIHRLHREQGRHLDHESHRLHRGEGSNSQDWESAEE
jgi:hypothetical protein